MKDRTKFLGGSDVADVFTLAPFGCARRLAYEKQAVEPDFQKVETVHMRRGIFFEPIIARLYTQETGRKLVKAKEKYLSGYPFLGGHADRLIAPGNRPLEIKCPSARTVVMIKREGLPESYILQLQFYIRQWEEASGSYAIFCPETATFLHFDVGLNLNLVDKIIEGCVKFWEARHNLDNFPRLDPKDKRCQTCGWRIKCQGLNLPVSPLGAERLTEEKALIIKALALQYLEAKEIQGEADDYTEELATRLKAEMGEITYAETPGVKVYYAPHEQNSLDTKALKEKYPEVVELFQTRKTVRPLKVYGG